VNHPAHLPTPVPTGPSNAVEAVNPDSPDHLLFDPEFEHVTIGTQLLNGVAIAVPFLGLVAAIILTWGWGITWVELGVLALMYTLTAGGVTLGFHRYFTHKSFECRRWVQWVLGVCGSMSVQGPMLGWIATHRCHHQHSDRPGDPHSPHVGHDHDEVGDTLSGLIKGYWHSHMGWLFHDDMPNLVRYIPDLKDDAVAKTVSKLFVVWVALGIVLPAVLGGWITGMVAEHEALAWSWRGALLGLLWGGLARISIVHHVTWSINSACHLWGTRTYKSHDHSRNNLLFGLLAFGEGWHNNHHAFPASARHGLEWYQFDATYLAIRLLKLTGLAWDINLPPADRLEAKKVADAVVGPHGKPITYTPPTKT
jgi:stearoyl-CoA desaturase (delta-9 desaturase)